MKKNLQEDTLRKLIRDLVGEVLAEKEEEEIDEMSVTGDIAGYETPFAFSGGRKAKTKQNSEKLGYKLVWDPETGDESDLIVPKKKYQMPKLTEGRGAYYDFKKDESLTPRQKIGHSIRIVRRSLAEAERLIDMNLRLKQEENVESKNYWKRTHEALSKIEEKLVRLVNKTKSFRD